MSWTSWDELERDALACEKCPLAGGRTQVVFGVGNRDADLVFVGEGPGYLKKDAPLTVEDVRDHFDEIERTDDFMLLRNATDELRVVSKLLG